MTFKERATILISRGIPVATVPPREKGSRLPRWQECCSTDPAQIEFWNQLNPDYNTAAVAKAIKGGVWMLDADIAGLKERIETETGQTLPPTFTVESSRGRRHYYWSQNVKSFVMGNVPKTDLREGLFDAQVHNKYVVGPGSIHPSGSVYTIVDDSPIVEAPDWLIAWITSYRKEKKFETRTEPETLIDDLKIAAGLDPYNARIEDGLIESDLGENRACPLHGMDVVTPGHENRSFAVLMSEAGYPIHRCHHSECGAKGDALNFIMQFDGVDFTTAYRKLMKETYGENELEEVLKDRNTIREYCRALGTTDYDAIMRALDQGFYTSKRVPERFRIRGENYWRHCISDYARGKNVPVLK